MSSKEDIYQEQKTTNFETNYNYDTIYSSCHECYGADNGNNIKTQVHGRSNGLSFEMERIAVDGLEEVLSNVTTSKKY